MRKVDNGEKKKLQGEKQENNARNSGYSLPVDRPNAGPTGTPTARANSMLRKKWILFSPFPGWVIFTNRMEGGISALYGHQRIFSILFLRGGVIIKRNQLSL